MEILLNRLLYIQEVCAHVLYMHVYISIYSLQHLDLYLTMFMQKLGEALCAHNPGRHFVFCFHILLQMS